MTVIMDKPPEKGTLANLVYVAEINIPSGGLVIDTNPVSFVALFEVEFASIETIVAKLTFKDDLWDPGETWYIPEFGGQINQDISPREDAALASKDCYTSFKFATGRFPFRLWAENGSFKITSLRFEVEGVPKSC